MAEYYLNKPKIEILAESENGDLFRLLEPMTYFRHNRILTIPAGFTSDGISVPPLLWISISPAIDRRTLSGAIAHDFLYRNVPEGWTRADADKMFYDIIRADGLSSWKALKAYCGVRLFGKKYWKGESK